MELQAAHVSVCRVLNGKKREPNIIDTAVFTPSRLPIDFLSNTRRVMTFSVRVILLYEQKTPTLFTSSFKQTWKKKHDFLVFFPDVRVVFLVFLKKGLFPVGNFKDLMYFRVVDIYVDLTAGFYLSDTLIPRLVLLSGLIQILKALLTFWC